MDDKDFRDFIGYGLSTGLFEENEKKVGHKPKQSKKPNFDNASTPQLFMITVCSIAIIVNFIWIMYAFFTDKISTGIFCLLLILMPIFWCVLICFLEKNFANKDDKSKKK